MNLDKLKIFLAVAEHKSFTKAAACLYISHSATSRNVSQLEHSLGVSLLQRDRRSVELTSAGEVLYREGENLLKRVYNVENAVKKAGDGISGCISIASVSLYSYILSNGYDAFCKKYPGVSVEMFHMELQDVVEQIRMGTADLGVTFSYAFPKADPLLKTMKVASESFCAVTPVDHPLAMKRFINVEDLRHSRIILLPSIGFDLLDSAGTIRESIGSDITTVPTLETLFLQVRSGNSISLVPYPIAFEFGGRCAILDLEGVDSDFDILLVWRKDSNNPSLPLIIETIRSQMHR